VTDEALEKIGRSRRVAVSVTSFLVLPEILMVSDLIAVVPRRLAIDQVGLTLLEPPVEIPGFRKMLAWHERTHRDAGQRWVRTLLVETVRTLGLCMCICRDVPMRKVPDRLVASID
jgi:DNA-binding transcriptional LysR family regulator